MCEAFFKWFFSTFAEVGSKEQIRLRADYGSLRKTCSSAKCESLYMVVVVSLKETLLLDTSGELAHFNKKEGINKR